MFLYNVPKFLFPPKCIFCGKYGENLCDICIKRIEKLEKMKVVKFQNKNLDFLIYFFKYEKLIRKLVLGYKFFNRPFVADVFVKIIVKNEKICGKLKFYDIIASVPMYKTKKLNRGYNQTELFSKSLAENLNVIYKQNLLKKVVKNNRQSALTFSQRQENVRGVFKVLEKNLIKGKKIILIDDIYTSRCNFRRMRQMFKRSRSKSCSWLSYCKRLGDF